MIVRDANRWYPDARQRFPRVQWSWLHSPDETLRMFFLVASLSGFAGALLAIVLWESGVRGIARAVSRMTGAGR
jgi:hypothetical protein